MFSRRRVEIFRLLKDGKEMGIALSETAARAMIPGHWAFNPGETDAWSVASEVRELDVVEGKVVDFWDDDGLSYPHVFWHCPACDEQHSTDLTSDDVNPALWYCNFGHGMFLVRRSADAEATEP